MSRVVNDTMYECLECGKRHRTEEYAIECEQDDKRRERVVRDSLDRAKVVSSLRGTSLYHASSLEDLEEYLGQCVSGCVESWECVSNTNTHVLC